MVESDTATVRSINDGRDLPAYSRLLQLQTVFIVTAAVHRSFDTKLISCENHSTSLTYRHWAGVSPYTLAFAFAGTCVLDKQSLSNLLLQPRFTVARHLP